MEMRDKIDHTRAYTVRKGWTVDEALVFVDDGIPGRSNANRSAGGSATKAGRSI
jgi:hypothetical protein